MSICRFVNIASNISPFTYKCNLTDQGLPPTFFFFFFFFHTVWNKDIAFIVEFYSTLSNIFLFLCSRLIEMVSWNSKITHEIKIPENVSTCSLKQYISTLFYHRSEKIKILQLKIVKIPNFQLLCKTLCLDLILY